MNLSPIIRELQDIKREVKSEKWGKCARPGVDSLVSSMNYEIEGFISFLDSDTSDYLVQSAMESAGSEREKFTEIHMMLRDKQSRRFWNSYLIEQKAKKFLNSFMVNQLLSYKDQEKFEMDLKNLQVQSGNMAVDLKKNLKDYKIDISLDQERLTTKILSKNDDLKSFVQILEPFKYDSSDFLLMRSLICESLKPSKKIESPEFTEEPKCPSGTLLVEKIW